MHSCRRPPCPLQYEMLPLAFPLFLAVVPLRCSVKQFANAYASDIVKGRGVTDRVTMKSLLFSLVLLGAILSCSGQRISKYVWKKTCRKSSASEEVSAVYYQFVILS
ncbi:hypothetical protein KC19_5G023200 [Ceratodon purpureus]|uniref:Uncharacterized protein n=1 Tax=Ceratodon purpureus TaxID=3225 RepID=A0A8T0HZ26_CERPU|nr:hypothetical protein KC19_5G023200 [Ceratodon purpureus]